MLNTELLSTLKAQANPSPPKQKALVMGFINHLNGILPKYPNNENYMTGYNSYEPVIVVKRIDGAMPQYSLANGNYEHFHEWHYSIQDALFFGNSWLMKRSVYALRAFTYDYWQFEKQVERDLRIKPDVTRIYRLDIEGNLNTSIDNGKTWFSGGIMSYPPLKKHSVREFASRCYRVPNCRFPFEVSSEYITRPLKPEELKKGTLEPKPPKPVEPKFDDLYWKNSPTKWWHEHLKESEKSANFLAALMIPDWAKWNLEKYPTQEELDYLESIKSCEFEYRYSPVTEKPNPAYIARKPDEPRYYEVQEWRCPCYHKKMADYQKRLADYQKQLAEWQEL